jgi:two-component system, NtrC family, sensor kinase
MKRADWSASFATAARSPIRKKWSCKIQQAEKLVAMGQLAAGVAHEINNPLGVILCYVDLLKRELADSPQGLQDLAVIESRP